jgi:hypothetical protein
MAEFTQGARDLGEAQEGAMEQGKAALDNLTGAVEGIGGDAMLQVQQGQAQITQGVTAANALTDNMKNKALAWKTAAQTTIAQKTAEKAGKSAEDLLKEVVPDPIGAITNAPGKLMDGITAVQKEGEEQQQKFDEGFQREKNKPPTPDPVETQEGSGRRRRRRRKSRKKRRKSRKKRRKSRKKRRRKRRRKTRKKRSRRRRRGGITCTLPEIATYNDNDKTWTCKEPKTTTYQEPSKRRKLFYGGRKSRKRRRRRKRSSKKSRRRSRR